MPRQTFALIALALCAGCTFPPQDFEDNRPGLGDALLDREIVVYGESRMHYYEDDNFICSLILDIQGWVEEEVSPSDVGCVGCSENFTLGFSVDEDSTCNHTIPGAATVAITPIGFFDRENNPEGFWEALTEEDDLPDVAAGPAVGFLSTNWSPQGQADWTPRLILYPPAEGSGLDTYEREYFAYGFYAWGTSQGSASWFMDLWLLQ